MAITNCVIHISYQSVLKLRCRGGREQPVMINFIAFAHLRNELSDGYYLPQACFIRIVGVPPLVVFCILKKYSSHFKCFILEDSLMHTCQIYIYTVPMLPFLSHCRCKSMLMLGTYINCYITFPV